MEDLESKSTFLTLPGFQLQRNGLVVSGEPTFEEWQTAGEFLRQCEGAVHWWIGDWLNYGERRYGEMYAQAIEATGYNYGTLANDKWVASQIEFSRRRENLPFSHHAEVAPLSPKEQDEFLAIAETEQLSSRDLRKRIASPKIHPVSGPDVTESIEELIGQGLKYGCIYADPPWQYGNQGTRAATDNHYPTMTVAEIAALPVKEIVADNAHLHIWTTNAFLFETKQVMESWGFEYKSVFVWVKPQMGIGNYWRVSHEFLLLGVRGSATFMDKNLMSWGEFPRTKHSSKPEPVRKMIMRSSPGPYLELFGRQLAESWTVFGNQVEETMFDDVG